MRKQLYNFMRGIRNRHVLAFDLFVLCWIPSCALLLRIESLDDATQFAIPILLYTAASIVWKLAVFYPVGMYNRYWRFASVDEMYTVVMANFASMVIGIVVFYAVLRPFNILGPDFPRSITMIDGLLTAMIVGGFRFALRLSHDMSEAKEAVPESKKKALIVGAGVAGSMILKELRMNPHLPIEPIGFLDDDVRKRYVRIHNVPVIGALADLPKLVKERGVQEVIIAMPTAHGKTIRSVVQMCKEAKIPSKTIPGIFEILSGSARVSQIRDIEIEDLLRRGVVTTDTDGVANLLRGARVMVTGAGGSIGAEMCRQINTLEPETLILVGHGENSIFQIVNELRGNSSQNQKQRLQARPTRIHSVIADVRDRERMRQVFQFHRPTIVFHAAAHKHVGLMEENIPDAVTNNVLATQVLIDLSEQFEVERFVMISSDKAVNPTCIMGVTKRVAELIVHDAAERMKKPFVSVRFGNVLGSRGSVVPIFKQQIAQGGPVSITHPDVKRYFMTIPEAVQLVLQAATMGEGGEVFVLDMGEPIRILDLARDLIRLSGMEEGSDIDIVYTGLQSGEKITEELFFQEERVQRSNHEKILVCQNGFHGTTAAPEHVSYGKNKFSSEVWPESPLRFDIEKLLAAAQSGALKNVKALLKHLVPQYQENIEVPEVGIFPLKRDAKPAMSLVEEVIAK